MRHYHRLQRIEQAIARSREQAETPMTLEEISVRLCQIFGSDSTDPEFLALREELVQWTESFLREHGEAP
jgi:hypothetical protein